jgi:hypothetical protein
MHRQRGALSQIQGRFESEARAPFDDGWTRDDEAPEPLATSVTIDDKFRSAIRHPLVGPAFRQPNKISEECPRRFYLCSIQNFR